MFPIQTDVQTVNNPSIESTHQWAASSEILKGYGDLNIYDHVCFKDLRPNGRNFVFEFQPNCTIPLSTILTEIYGIPQEEAIDIAYYSSDDIFIDDPYSVLVGPANKNIIGEIDWGTGATIHMRFSRGRGMVYVIRKDGSKQDLGTPEEVMDVFLRNAILTGDLVYAPEPATQIPDNTPTPIPSNTPTPKESNTPKPTERSEMSEEEKKAIKEIISIVLAIGIPATPILLYLMKRLKEQETQTSDQTKKTATKVEKAEVTGPITRVSLPEEKAPPLTISVVPNESSLEKDINDKEKELNPLLQRIRDDEIEQSRQLRAQEKAARLSEVIELTYKFLQVWKKWKN